MTQQIVAFRLTDKQYRENLCTIHFGPSWQIAVKTLSSKNPVYVDMQESPKILKADYKDLINKLEGVLGEKKAQKVRSVCATNESQHAYFISIMLAIIKLWQP
jgi:hypothetical protein